MTLFVKSLFIMLSLVLCLSAAPDLYAQNQNIQAMLNDAAGSQGAGFNTSSNIANTGIATIVGSIVRAMLSLLGVLFISYTIYGGFIWMTARGNEDNITKAKQTIRDGVIGIIIVLASLSIYLFIYNILIGRPAGV